MKPQLLPILERIETLIDRAKVFCPTGPGGGVDPTCGSGGGGSSGSSGTHNVKLPRNPKKLNITTAGEALSQMGYQLHFNEGKFDLTTKIRTYGLTKPDGSHSIVSTDEIIEIVYQGYREG